MRSKKVTYTGRIVYRLRKNNAKANDFPLKNHVIEVNGTKTKTDSNGNFRVNTDEFKSKKICVKIPAENDYVKVRPKGRASSYAKEHRYPPNEVVNYKIPQIYLLERDDESIAVMISQRLIYAYELLKKIGWNDKDKVSVVYPLKNLTYDCHDILYIQGGLYDDATLFHEFAHSVAFEYKFMAFSYHQHNALSNRMVDVPKGCLPISKKSCTKLTFNEGFAEFFSRMVIKTFQKELDIADANYYDGYYYPLAKGQHKYFGEVMEECVGSVLYEMIDSNFESYYPSELKDHPSGIDLKKLMNWIREYGKKNYKNEHFSGFIGYIRDKYKLDYARMFNVFEKYGFAIRNISFTSKTRTFKFENGGDSRPNARAASMLNSLLCNIYNPSEKKWYQIKEFNLNNCTCQIPLDTYKKLGKKFGCYFSCSQIDSSGFKTGPYFTGDRWFDK